VRWALTEVVYIRVADARREGKGVEIEVRSDRYFCQSRAEASNLAAGKGRALAASFFRSSGTCWHPDKSGSDVSRIHFLCLLYLQNLTESRDFHEELYLILDARYSRKVAKPYVNNIAGI
jgi:hypothetical protein